MGRNVLGWMVGEVVGGEEGSGLDGGGGSGWEEGSGLNDGGGCGWGGRFWVE